MTNRAPLTEPQALADAVEALREAGRPDLADYMGESAADEAEAIHVLLSLPRRSAPSKPDGAMDALCALRLVRAGYTVTPPPHKHERVSPRPAGVHTHVPGVEVSEDPTHPHGGEPPPTPRTAK